MKITKKELEKIKEYFNFLVKYKMQNSISDKEFADHSIKYGQFLLNKHHDGETISDEEFLKQIARYSLLSTGDGMNISALSDFGKVFKLHPMNAYFTASIIMQDIPDDFEFDSNIRIDLFETPFRMIEGKEMGEQIEKIGNQETELYNYNKESLKTNDEKGEEYLNDLIDESRKFKEKIDGLDKGRQDSFIFDSYNAIDVHLENAFSPNTKEDDRTKEANKALFIYFNALDFGFEKDETKEKLKKVLKLNEKEFNTLGSIITRKVIKSNDMNLSQEERMFEDKMNEKFVEYADLRDKEIKESIKNSFKKDNNSQEKIDGLMNCAAIYKNQKEKYSTLFNTRNIFKLIKNYFSSDARNMRQNIKDIEKGFKGNNIDIKNVEKDNFFGNMSKLINGVNENKEPQKEEKKETIEPEKKQVKGLEEKFSPTKKEEVVKQKEEVKVETKTISKNK